MSPTPVLFVHHRPQASGAARSLAMLVEALGEQWQPHVLAPAGPAAALLRTAGADVHEAPVPAFTHTWDVQYRGARWAVLGREAVWLPQHARALRQLLRRVRPALVHLNDSVLLASGAIASHRGVPVVWHLRSSLAHGGQDPRSRRIARLLERWGSAAVAIDRDVARTFRLGLPVEVVPNPVRAEPGPAAELGVPAGRVAVGYFGYLRRQKGWPQLVDAMRLLAAEDVPVHAVIVGGGVRPSAAFRGLRGRALGAVGVTDEEDELRRRVAEAGLDDRFTYLPFADDPAPVLRALDVVVFPNQGTGLGRPVLEAAAYGKPVVASGSADGAGILLPDETGILLERATADAIANALRRLAEDEPLRRRLGESAARHATGWSPTATSASVEAVWRGVLR